jgi:TonB family protein
VIEFVFRFPETFMRRLWLNALIVLLAAGASSGQQTSSSASSQLANALPTPVKIYAVGQGVKAPEFLPANAPPIPDEKCKKKVDGNVQISVLVDSTGRPRNLMFLHPLGTDLDKFALLIVAEDRFNPGTIDGAPVTVGESVDVSLQTCLVKTRDDAGKSKLSLRLRSQPTQKFGNLPQIPEIAVLTAGTPWETSRKAAPSADHVGGSVTAPVALNTVEAKYTPEASSAKINGNCLISLIVDRQGMPQDIKVVKALDPGLDQNAMDAVDRYRFKPAMRNGEPVPVMLTVEVAFRVY